MHILKKDMAFLGKISYDLWTTEEQLSFYFNKSA